LKKIEAFKDAPVNVDRAETAYTVRLLIGKRDDEMVFVIARQIVEHISTHMAEGKVCDGLFFSPSAAAYFCF
jgi:hypothetical protein